MATIDGGRRGPYSRQQFKGAADGQRLELSEGYRTVEVDTPSSQRLRDLASFRRDLELAKLFSETLVERGVDSFQNTRHPDIALWIASLTTYGRAFNNGVRKSEQPNIEILTEDEKVQHQYLLDLRDKHVAHAVNDHEQTIVLAFLANSAFAKPGISRVGQTHVEVVPSEDDAIALISLCKKHLLDLNRRMGAVSAMITVELHAMGLEAVYALPDLVAPTYDAARVTKKRKGTIPNRRRP